MYHKSVVGVVDKSMGIERAGATRGSIGTLIRTLCQRPSSGSKRRLHQPDKTSASHHSFPLQQQQRKRERERERERENTQVNSI